VIRRISSLLVAALTIFSVLPMTAAFAQASATAELTSNLAVYPGNRTFTIKVTNTESAVGRKINAVTISLPTASANVVFRDTPPAAGGFDNVKVVKADDSQIVNYKGGSIAPGASQSFTLPVTVRRPYRSDLAGRFWVQVSSDNGVTASNVAPPAPGLLTTSVEALQIIPGTLRPTAPTNADNTKGVTDRTGTAGQRVTYSFTVKNYAREDLTVTGALAAGGASDRPGAAISKVVKGLDGRASFGLPITFGPATTDRAATLRATATAPKATAVPADDSFTVQPAVALDFTSLVPTRVRSGFGTAREFNVIVDKTGSSTFRMTDSILKFGSNAATLTEGVIEFGANARTRELSYQIAEVTGDNGAFQANIASVGQDVNLANYSLNRNVGTITIDNNVPTITLAQPVLGNNGVDAEGDKLIAATDGTQIKILGEAVGTDLDKTTLKVSLRPDVGAPITVPVVATDDVDGISFTGTIAGAAVNWADGATRFVATAEIADQATNVGTAQSGFTVIDQLRPVLDRNSGVVIATRRIRVQFDDQTGVRGACDPSSWRVNGSVGRVVEVRTADGALCSGSSAEAVSISKKLSHDGVRVLTLNYDLGPDDTPTVTYSTGLSEGSARRLGVYLAKDGAANDAAEQTISTITDIIPPAPDVNNVRRKDHVTGDREPAYLDLEENAYYTNVGGDNALVATVGGVRRNYRIQVVDENGDVIATQAAQTPEGLSPLATEWTQDVSIPIGTDDDTYVRGIRLVSTAGKASLQTALKFVLDTLRPTISQATLSGPGEAHVTFGEKVVSGADKYEDWYVTWTMVTEGETRTVHSSVDDVSVIEGQTLRMRRAVFTGIDETTFQGLDYMVRDDSTARYEDRAGNFMGDTLISE
jgi:hypothetical protein